MLSNEKNDYYKTLANNVRKRMIRVGEICAHQVHWGGSLSCVEIMVYLAFEHNNSNIIMSKGHAALCVYSTYEEAGLLPNGCCERFQENGGDLTEELEKNDELGIECSTGSLGMGLSYSVGKALRIKRDNDSGKVFCIIGDGECNEGAVWEAIMLAAHQKLDNLVLIIDFNGLQLCGPTKDIILMDNIDARLSSFGWKTLIIDGHNFFEIEKAVEMEHIGKPLAIIARTKKGKGISFMENNPAWHDRKISREELEIAKYEVGIR